MTKIFARFFKDESGATAIEYGLIAALISVALITGASTLGNSLDNTFTNLSTELNKNQP
ncbi:Flp family type IVb pilin [Rhizobium arsenicireducens]